MTENAQLGVYEAIADVMGDLSKDGIPKDRKSIGVAAYNFRGIDDVYNVLATLLSKHNLVILPRVLSHEQHERQTKNGGTIIYTIVEAEYDIVCALDGSKHVVRTIGEAMDTSDKSTNKAMSAAYKYMAFQTFCIPTEGDNDADASNEPLPPKKKAGERQDAAPQKFPNKSPNAAGQSDDPFDGNDWVAWGEQFVAAVKACGNKREALGVFAARSSDLTAMKAEAPAVYARFYKLAQDAGRALSASVER